MSALDGQRIVYAACGKWYTAAVTGESNFRECIRRCVCAVYVTSVHASRAQRY